MGSRKALKVRVGNVAGASLAAIAKAALDASDFVAAVESIRTKLPDEVAGEYGQLKAAVIDKLRLEGEYLRLSDELESLEGGRPNAGEQP